MTDQERIDELKRMPPHIELTRRQKIARVIGWFCSGIAIVALTVSVYATKQAWEVSGCVNRTLGDRAPVTAGDNAAHIAFAIALQKVLQAPKEQQASEYTTFLAGLNNYVKTLSADQAYRNANPLGRC